MRVSISGSAFLFVVAIAFVRAEFNPDTFLPTAYFFGAKNHQPDPDVESDSENSEPTNKIIHRHGYPSESHEVTTEDGYILTMHRIPRGKGQFYRQKQSERAPQQPTTAPMPPPTTTGPLTTTVAPLQNHLPVYFQHGILGSSADWVIHGPNKSLAYMLADQGHDVWLGNVRGNTYSRGHVSLSPDDVAFWNFTFNEMALHDVSAMIDHILETTGHDELYYVGHSMGTTVFYILCSSRPVYNAKVKAMFSLAPIAFMSNAQSPIRYFAPYAKDIVLISRWFGDGEFLPRNAFINFVLKYGCEISAFESRICENNLFIICGHDPEQFETSLLPVIFGHTPAGTSTKTLQHYAQLIQSGQFREFDYGPSGNLEAYNSEVPPAYNLSLITAPVFLYFSDNDLLANPKDVKKLAGLLPNLMAAFRVEFHLFNHLDFLWSRDVNSLLNDNVMSHIENSHNNGVITRSPVFLDEIAISREDDDPVFNDISSLLKHKAYSLGKETLDNVMNFKMSTETKLNRLKQKTKSTLERKLKSLKSLFTFNIGFGKDGSQQEENANEQIDLNAIQTV